MTFILDFAAAAAVAETAANAGNELRKERSCRWWWWDLWNGSGELCKHTEEAVVLEQEEDEREFI